MAHYLAIGGVSTALQGILMDARGGDIGTPAIEVVRSSEIGTERPAETGVSILLYRTAVSPYPRNLTGRTPPGGRPKLPPLPVDLHYAFAPWGKTSLAEHRLLGWLMRTLEDSNTLNSGQLNAYSGTPGLFSADETVSLIPESLSLQDLSYLWELIKANPRVCVGYVARVVHLESLVEQPTGERVQVRDFDLAKVTS